MHQLTRIARVSLQQHRLLMAAAADTGAVSEFAFGAIIYRVDLHIAGQWLAECLVVRRYITLLRAGNRKNQPS